MTENSLFPPKIYCFFCNHVINNDEVVSHYMREHDYPDDLTEQKLYDRLSRVAGIMEYVDAPNRVEEIYHEHQRYVDESKQS
jgi:hypothetical protein